MQPDEKKQFLNDLPLFSQLSDTELNYLASQARIKRINTGDVVIQVNDKTQGLYIVISGVVTLTLISEEGESRVVEIIYPGQSFAEALLFLDKPSPVRAEMINGGELLFVPGRDLVKLAGESSNFTRSMLAGLSLRLHTLVVDIQSCSLNRAHQRVIGYLLGEMREADIKSNTIICLPVSKKLVASMLDLSAETFSRVLHDLSEQGLVKIDGRKIEIINMLALKSYKSIKM